MKYIYNLSCTEEERSLFALEMRALFGQDPSGFIMESNVGIDPSRSPFIRDRLEIWLEADHEDELIKQAQQREPITQTYKVMYVKNPKLEKVDFNERRRLERELGLAIQGPVDMQNPDVIIGIQKVNGRLILGKYEESQAVWLHHQQKPHSYSTALSTRVARAVVNIAVPQIEGMKAIDPCCGVGTVVVEGRSMGMDIVGSDANPLILPGARENLAYFGLEADIRYRDIREVSGAYDVAIIDMPYNLCSVISEEEKLGLLMSAATFTKKLVIVTIEPMDHLIETSGFQIVDRGVVKKGQFVREVIVAKQ